MENRWNCVEFPDIRISCIREMHWQKKITVLMRIWSGKLEQIRSVLHTISIVRISMMYAMSMDLSYGQRSRTSAARAMIRRHMKTAVSRWKIWSIRTTIMHVSASGESQMRLRSTVRNQGLWTTTEISMPLSKSWIRPDWQRWHMWHCSPRTVIFTVWQM